MNDRLDNWQTRLDIHFTGLKRRRMNRVLDRPIFGLEHGLDDIELSNLTTDIKTQIKQGSPCWDHRLVWVVYASEFGYLYGGDEYWQTFEAKTPGWEHHGDRHWIRRCFIDFHDCYCGAKPTGRWADHFSIICWPITHAILPRDLQHQLARILYDIRHTLSIQILESHTQLGGLIAERNWNTSPRFQQLTEEPRFLGQIANALLLQGEGISSALINPTTLSRISADVDRKRRARAWLRGARQGAQRRVRFHHIRGQGVENVGAKTDDAMKTGSITTPSFEPRLVLRRLDSSKWEILLELPDLSHIPMKFARLTEVLKSSQCYVRGSSGRPLAKSGLLYGTRHVILRSWPSYDKPLLKFDKSTPELDNLLRTDCMLRPGPVWLFKVGSDDHAYELKSAGIRSEQRYIVLVKDDDDLPKHPELVPVRIECDGVKAVEIQLADTITPGLTDALSTLGISQASSIYIWPAGLVPVRWDGEGVAEWLSTDRPNLGIRADYHVTAISIDLGFDRINVSPSSPGASMFIELPELDPGVYTANINATNGDGTVTKSQSLEFRIREPRTWSPGLSNANAIFHVVEPNNPTLEQLWEDKIEFQVHGPVSRKVNSDIAFFERGKNQPILRIRLPPLSLPINTSKWRKHFHLYFKEKKKAQNAYDFAQSCHVSIAVGELGAFTLIAEREFSPLRWAVKRTKEGFFLRVLDDSGVEQTPRVSWYEFGAPDVEQHLDITSYNRAEGAIASSGLYVACTDSYQQSVVIPPEIHNFLDLRIEPCISDRQRNTVDIIDLISMMERWVCARVTGNLFSFFMRRKVLQTFILEAFHLIAGGRWQEVEKMLHQSDGKSVLECAKTHLRNRDEIKMAESVMEQIQALTHMSPWNRTRLLAFLSGHYLNLGKRYSADSGAKGGVDSDLLWLSELALRLGSICPSTKSWARDNLSQGISNLLDVPSLARAARFMVLAIDQTFDHSEIGSNLYKDWLWD